MERHGVGAPELGQLGVAQPTARHLAGVEVATRQPPLPERADLLGLGPDLIGALGESVGMPGELADRLTRPSGISVPGQRLEDPETQS